jgi:hypothetical protein
MPPTPQHYALAAGIAALVAVGSLWRFLVRLKRDRVVADTPAMRIRSAAQGYVKVNGHVQPAGPAPAAAPLTGRPCVWWEFRVERAGRDARGNRRWDTVERAASVELFTLIDEDGAQCLVGPVRAEVTPSCSDVWYGSGPRPDGPPPAQRSFLSSGDWRYTERLLAVGAQVCVLGDLRSHSEVGDVGAAVAAKLHAWKEDPQALLARFDQDHDGKISAAEWDAARAAAEAEVRAEQLKSNVVRTSVISQPTNGEPFLIAPLTAALLERRERLFAGLYFVLGLASVAACAWALQKAL